MTYYVEGIWETRTYFQDDAFLMLQQSIQLFSKEECLFLIITFTWNDFRHHQSDYRVLNFNNNI